MLETATAKERNDESLFFWFAIAFSAFLAVAFGVLLFALNHLDRAPASADALPDSQPETFAPDHPRQLVNFSLTDQAGGTVTRADLDGKFLVVSFLFTSCSLTCPVVSGQMERIGQLTANQPDVRLVSLTVDPEDDTVPVLAKFSRRFGATTNRWLFLTGDQTALHHLIGTSFLSRDTSDAFGYMPGNFAHIERIALVDPQGRVREYFDGLGASTPRAVVAEITKLRQQHHE